MVQKERPRTRRRGRRTVFGRAGVSAPLSHDFARPLLPAHWTSLVDATAMAEIRDEMRLLEELGGYCPMDRIFW